MNENGMELSATDIALLEAIADMEKGLAEGAVNIRKDSGCATRVETDNIKIVSKTDVSGIDIHIAPAQRKAATFPWSSPRAACRRSCITTSMWARART